MTKCAYEEALNAGIKSSEAFRYKKTSEAPVCKKCGMFLVAKPKNGYTELHCGNILEGCDYSFVEETE
jgi:hypothetical protein